MSGKDNIFDENGPRLADFLPDTSSGYTVHAGVPLEHPIASDEGQVIAALKTVKDPEIPVNIYDLGLIYEVVCQANGNVKISMSLTAPGCPVAGEIPQMVADAVAQIDAVGCVSVTLVWSPAWTPERMSEDAKLALDFDF